MKLEEGMYVRTRKGIGKVVEHKKHESWGCLVKIKGQYSCYTHTSNGELTDVIKASHNIIDLIEVGDYVNGLLVIRILEDIETKEKYINLYGSLSEWEEEDIKSIVTREQFESIKYEVKEDE